MIRAQNESRKLVLQELREENKIMAKYLSSMMDPFQLQDYQNERARIWGKWNAQVCQESTASASVDEYLKKIGGFLYDFPHN